MWGNVLMYKLLSEGYGMVSCADDDRVMRALETNKTEFFFNSFLCFIFNV